MGISEILKKLTVRMSDQVKTALEKYADQSGLSEAAAAERFIALGLYNNGCLEQVPPVERKRGGKRSGAGRPKKSTVIAEVGDLSEFREADRAIQDETGNAIDRDDSK